MEGSGRAQIRNKVSTGKEKAHWEKGNGSQRQGYWTRRRRSCDKGDDGEEVKKVGTGRVIKGAS